MAFTLEDGRFLVETARKAIVEYLAEGNVEIHTDEMFKKKQGVFVTLESYPGKELRGCIGYPYPTMPLIEALAQAAISAAVHDPRFPAVSKEEFRKTLVEVTVLTPPEEIIVKNKNELPGKVKIGKHGLIVEHGPFSGLLLPQVATERKWSAEEFLGETCWKAGLSPDMWLDKETKVYCFEGQIFAEESPAGKVVEKKI